MENATKNIMRDTPSNCNCALMLAFISKLIISNSAGIHLNTKCKMQGKNLSFPVLAPDTMSGLLLFFYSKSYSDGTARVIH
jgi:hypothetical protein